MFRFVKKTMNEQISLFETNEKRELTTEAINELFGIKESFELPEVLLRKLLNKQEKDDLCRAFMRFKFDISNDCLRDYFQENNANRNNLKQDYTPDCLCKLISELVPKADRVIDICSGTGALTVGMNRDIRYQCEEVSAMSIPVLLFNLALRNLTATVVQKDILLNKTEKVYKVSKSEKFSDIVILNNYNEKKTDIVISNPPYSLKWQPKSDKRFDGYELAPAKASDYAFILDGLSRLTETGQAFYILPHGILFRGGAEGKIRKQLIENNLIDTIISLPDKMFLNTSIPVCIVVFNKAKQTNDTLFIDASKLFIKNGKQNVMTDEHIKQITEVYWDRKSVDKFASLVSLSKIRENEYNLNIPRYVDTYEPEELPPLSEITKDLIKCNLNINKATNDLLQMLQELCGDDEYNKIKSDFVEFFSKQDVVGQTMIDFLRMQNLEKGTNYIATHAKKERRPILELADFERVKKGKIYEAGTVYIQLSATDGKVKFLTESKELETKYGVFLPKTKNIGSRYLFYMLDFEMPSFLRKYQNGMNINPDIFKYLQVTYYPEYRYQKELVMILDEIQFMYNQELNEKEQWEYFKKFHLNGMFPSSKGA